MHQTDTQETILKAASRLFASQGYAVSMREVAAAVGVTVANLYYHFKDKEDLVRATLSHVFSERMSPLEDILEQHESPEQRLEVFISWFVQLIFGEEIFTRLLFRELLDGNGVRLRYLSKTVFKEPFARLTRLIEDCPKTPDPAMMAASVVSVILGHYQLACLLPHLPGGRPEHSDPTVITRHLLMLIRATVIRSRIEGGLK
jgi:AcrR family transcriptional regulator